MISYGYSFILIANAVWSLIVAAAAAAAPDVVVMDDIEVHSGTVKIWPKGIVPYHISSTLDLNAVNKIKLAMKTIEQSVNGASDSCIRFVPQTTEAKYVEIYKGTGCFSSVGMLDGTRQEVSIGTGCEFKGIIMHELLHTLGFYHEHSRSDRDDNVEIDLSNVSQDDRKNFDIIKEINLLGTAYDPESIMSYDAYMKASDGSKPVMVLKQEKAKDVFQMGQRMWLSDLDVLRIQTLYGCTKDKSHVVRPERKNTILACNFQAGPDLEKSHLCGMANAGGQFDWVAQNYASSDGPSTGHSIGADYYLVAKAYGNSGKMARITTPSYTVGTVCLDFYMFVKHQSSSLNIEISGPDFMTQKLKVAQSDTGYGRWTRYQKQISLPFGISFQISFKATIGSADVALDDLLVYKGACQ